MEYSTLLLGFDTYPKPAASLAYGTAGFRAKAYLLDHVAYRSGILAVLRSMAAHKVVGLMITASHNPEEDNGVKLIDPDGGMLDLRWEEHATAIVNSDKTSIESKIKSMIAEFSIDVLSRGTVLLAWDSRPSSETLVRIAKEGISSVNGHDLVVGMYPTPILHYFVRCQNDSSYGLPSIGAYFTKLCTAFDSLWQKNTNEKHGNYEPEVFFDGANGVGIITMKQANSELANKLKIKFFNNEVGVPGKLNYKCGADYVKQLQKMPENVVVQPFERCVSFDGDADRIVYYYIDEKEQFHLMDGDRMATLIAMYLKEILNEANMKASFGIVQTAYANGNATRYASHDLKIDVSCVSTGVKHLHAKAREYDIGIYFEANGHGTVVFSNTLKEEMHRRFSSSRGKEAEALNTLHSFINMTNETIGDAFSDFLLIETILHAKNWNIQNWKALYHDLPNLQTRVTVKDRNVITTTDAERKVVTPEELQREIDSLVARYNSARAFVRPSGTEDIVRVYAEAATEAEVKELARKVARLVYDLADGIGGRP